MTGVTKDGCSLSKRIHWLIIIGILISVLGIGMPVCADTPGPAIWRTTTVDSGLGSESVFSSLDVDWQGHPHISYYDGVKRSLKYAEWTGSSWRIEILESPYPGFAHVGFFNSLVLDVDKDGASPLPIISYYYGPFNGLKCAFWTGSKWELTTVDKYGYDSSIHLKYFAGPKAVYPVISYYDKHNQDLRYAEWTGSKWNTQAVDRTGDVGRNSALDLDNEGHPHISYDDTTNGKLKYAQWTGSKWKITTLPTDNGGTTSSIQAYTSGVGHKVAISYYDGNLNYMEGDGSNWQYSLQPDSRIVDPNAYRGKYSSLFKYDQFGPIISYADTLRSDKLYYAYKDPNGHWNWTVVAPLSMQQEVQSSLAYPPKISYIDNGELKYAQYIPQGYAPSVSSIQPNQAIAGSYNLQTIVTGGDSSKRNFILDPIPISVKLTKYCPFPPCAKETPIVATNVKYIHSSAIQCDFSIPLDRHGSYNVVVTNPDGLSGTLENAFTVSSPQPYITDITPNSAKAGDPAFTLRVTGSGFTPESKVRWNGVDRTTTYLSESSLGAAISASDIQTPGIRNITIFNPSPGGGNSYKATFPVIDKTRKEKIVFASNRDGNANIYSMNPDGTEQFRFTENTMEDIEPTLSPDGKKIAWVSDKTGNKEIHVINVDGTNPIKLTNNLSEDINPAWSPDGSRIAFSSKRGDGSTFDIYVMKADGTGLTRLTKNQDYDLEPCWSPDGSKIAFMSDRDGTLQIHVMNKDGSGQTRLNIDHQSGRDPAWSPDNLKIAFTSSGTGGSDIFVRRYDGNTIQLTNSPVGDRNPTWSPDGSKIAYEAYGVNNRDIYSMNADGTNQNRIVNNPADDYDPSWGYATTIIPPTPLPPGVLTAAFTNATPRSGTAPLTVSFTDQSTGTITTYTWNFGDGGTSPIQNPSHQYTTSGTYSVNLTVSGPSGSDSELKTNYITVNPAMVAPVAGFSGTPPSGTAPLTVNFADESTGIVTSWDWDFGDGKSSSLQHPVHIYASAGTYTVKLKVIGPKGSDDEIQSDYIKVSVPVKVRIVPTTLNTASKGKFVAFITLPSTYKAADVDAKSVKCEGATALKIMRSKAFPNTFAAIFNRDQLEILKPQDKVQLTVTGSINKNGQKVGFSGSDTIKIISKKGAVKEVIDDIDTMTEEKVFSQFNPQ